MITKITVVDDNNVTKEYAVTDGLGIFICEGEEKDDPFVVSQMTANQSVQLAMLKAIIKED